MSRGLAAAALLSFLAACGDSRDERLANQIVSECNALAPGVTINELIRQFDGYRDLFLAECRDDFTEMRGGDACDESQSLCTIRFQWLSVDSGTCGATGCAFGCDIRTADVANGGEPPVTTPICSSRGFREQPYFIPR